MDDIVNQKQLLVRARERSASRFFFIAALTLISTVAKFFFSSTYVSASALGIVELVNSASPDRSVAIGFAIVMAAIFAAFGFFARSGNIPVFLTGIVLYALDALLLTFFKVWLGVALHAYILYNLYNGVQYTLAHKKILAQEEEQLRRQKFTQSTQRLP